MLTIKNKDKIAQTEFHCNGIEWIVYGVDETNEFYNIFLMPKVNGIFDINKFKSIKLNRVCQSLRHYKVSSDGNLDSYIPQSTLKKPLELLEFISHKFLIYHNI